MPATPTCGPGWPRTRPAEFLANINPGAANSPSWLQFHWGGGEQGAERARGSTMALQRGPQLSCRTGVSWMVPIASTEPAPRVKPARRERRHPGSQPPTMPCPLPKLEARTVGEGVAFPAHALGFSCGRSCPMRSFVGRETEAQSRRGTGQDTLARQGGKRSPGTSLYTPCPSQTYPGGGITCLHRWSRGQWMRT